MRPRVARPHDARVGNTKVELNTLPTHPSHAPQKPDVYDTLFNQAHVTHRARIEVCEDRSTRWRPMHAGTRAP